MMVRSCHGSEGGDGFGFNSVPLKSGLGDVACVVFGDSEREFRLHKWILGKVCKLFSK